MIHATVTLSLTGMKRFASSIASGGPVVQRILKVWAARYRGFAQRRFASYSKGGGDWPPLSDATIARRRTGGGSGEPAILRDTNTMFRALDPVFVGAPGGLERYEKMSVEVGYGGPGAYPESSATVADIASFHNLGEGSNPERTIIVPPDDRCKSGMCRDAERLLNQDAKETIGE